MFSSPSYTIEQCGFQSGMKVADLGAGSGALSLLVARHVGDSGKVYAVEVQKDLLERLKNLAKHDHVLNIEIIWGDIEQPNGTHLKDHTVDMAIASNVLFQVEHKEGFVKEAKRILKPGGKVVLVDWSESFGGMGPSSEHVVGEQQGRALFEAGGFEFVKKIDAGEHHYGMIFKKV
ncbi:MAG: hypothetical protein COV91_03655 [Candidatus Taylorbacteria bacterium CG11_big_fil_rev_8_21_14_0_20_46_11]|uniref:Methyltransferase domain-containing protein n=1 Tax=Candidatus Taylorbacteria bacterium CG11_big_fil_rev_8_21_14_0_20_46_11 TaxID=1975025 RepID=A0A2H0KD72_9BACT|nr:MAG: hypothetical protein COV91_03655 [Candidatus Taylorbacteria bacterium CG11_big_fil_rev_8_21_14_0_20_46_11]